MISGRRAPLSPDRSNVVQSTAVAVVEVAAAPTWRSLLPVHRLSVVSKTPFLIAAGAYLAGLREVTPTLLAAMAIGALLWTALYAFNELTDLRAEGGFAISDAWVVRLAVLVAAACLAAFALTPILAILCVVMVAGQLAYCAPPWRLKRFWWAAPVLSGTVNPMMRLACGTLLGPKSVALSVYAIVVALHLGAAIRSRLLLRERDRGFGYLTAPACLHVAGVAASAFGVVGVFWLSRQGAVPSFFQPMTLAAAVYTGYAWSGRQTDVARLRQGWIWFSLISVLVLLLLLRGR